MNGLRSEGATGCSHGWSGRFARATRGNGVSRAFRPGGAGETLALRSCPRIQHLLRPRRGGFLPAPASTGSTMLRIAPPVATPPGPGGAGRPKARPQAPGHPRRASVGGVRAGMAALRRGGAARRDRPGRLDGRPGLADGIPRQSDGHPARPDCSPGRSDGPPGRLEGRPDEPDSRPGELEGSGAASREGMAARRRLGDAPRRPGVAPRKGVHGAWGRGMCALARGLFVPEGRRGVATGGARASRAQPVGRMRVNVSCPGGAEEVIGARGGRSHANGRFLRACRGGIHTLNALHGLRSLEDSLTPPVATTRDPSGVEGGAHG